MFKPIMGKKLTQNERLTWLIQYLLSERKDDDPCVPNNGKDTFDQYRSLVNERPPHLVTEEYLKIQNEFLQELNRARGIVSPDQLVEHAKDLYIWKGDITLLAADAIVNAANSQLLGCFQPLHTCIDNCIHTFSGIQLREACYQIMSRQGHPEFTGNAKITPAFNLPSKFVLHTVGPIVDGRLTKRHEELLISSYKNCLELAAENGCKSVAFCCISTGVFCFPNEQAAQIAIDTVSRYRPDGMKVIFNVYKKYDEELYRKYLKIEREN